VVTVETRLAESSPEVRKMIGAGSFMTADHVYDRAPMSPEATRASVYNACMEGNWPLALYVSTNK
jgi:hypothetical protein